MTNIEELGVQVEDNVTIETFDVEAIKKDIPEWSRLPKASRRNVLANGMVEPTSVGSTHNVTSEYLHQYIPALLNPFNDYERVADPPIEVALGEGTPPTGGFTSGADGLVDEFGRISLTDPQNDDTTFIASELITSTEFTTKDITELGIVTESGEFWNFVEPPTVIERSAGEAHLINFTIPFGDAVELTS